MGDAIGKIVEELMEVFKRNYKRPKLWFSLIALIILFVLLLPYIDSNFFYYSRMEKRIDILEHVMELDQNKINSNQTYINEYQSILQEMEQQNERTINSLMNKLINLVNDLMILDSNMKYERGLKFITGALWFIIITICVPFMNTFKRRIEKLFAFVLMIFITIAIGWFFASIPILISPLINYIGFPILQLFFAMWLVNKNNARKKNTNIE